MGMHRLASIRSSSSYNEDQKIELGLLRDSASRNSDSVSVDVQDVTSEVPANCFTKFDTAIRNGDLDGEEGLKKLLRSYPDFNLASTNDSSQNLLHILAASSSCRENKRLRIAEKLLPALSNTFGAELFQKVDVFGNTPMHYAAFFKRKQMLDWLIDKDVTHEVRFKENNEKSSPMHYLAKGRKDTSVDSMKKILEGAILTPFSQFSPLHSAAAAGSLKMVTFLIESQNFPTGKWDRPGDEEDEDTWNGMVPLHWAIVSSDETPAAFQCINYLLEKTEAKCYRTQLTKDSPIHLAAIYAKPKTLKYLLEVNEKVQQDGNPEPPALIEQQRQYLSLTRALNKKNQTCLHVIPKSTLSQGSLDCLKVILDHSKLSAPCNMNTFCVRVDSDGKTPIDLAAEFETVPIGEQILQRLECTAKSEWLDKPVLANLYRHIPDALIPVFESSWKQRNKFSRRSQPFRAELAAILGKRLVVNEPEPETMYLVQTLYAGKTVRDRILKNQLVARFVNEKWRLVSPFLYCGFIFHMAYIVLYTTLVYQVFEECHSSGDNLPPFQKETSVPCDLLDFSDFEKALSVLTVAGALVLLIKEVQQFYTKTSFRYYFEKSSNWLQCSLILITVFTTASLFLRERNVLLISDAWIRVFAVVGVLIGGFLSLYELKKVSPFGAFSRIFLKVATKSAALFGCYTILILAFMVSFRVLTPENGHFALPSGVVRVIAMMVGEFGYEENLGLGRKPDLDLLVTAKLIVFALFIFVAAIVGLNLLIGLAVEDMHGLQEDANLEILATRLEQINMIESFLISLKPVLGKEMFDTLLKRTNLVLKPGNEDKEDSRYFNTKLKFK